MPYPRPLALVLALGLAGAAPAPATRPLQPADLWQLQQVESPVVAPDGRRVLFTRMFFDEGLDRRQAELWLAHLGDDGAVIDRRLLVPAALAPREASFSPDGGRIAFVGQHLGAPQVFVLELSDPVPRPITSGEVEPQGPVWSPDGRRIAFVGRVPLPVPRVEGVPPRPRGAERAPEPTIVTDLFWRTDAAGERKPGAHHLFVVEAAGGPTLQLTAGSRDAVDPTGIAWTADGRHLIASVKPDPVRQPSESDLWRFDASRPGAAPVRLTFRAGSELQPVISPDGRWLAFTGAEATRDFYPMPEAWITEPQSAAPIRRVAPALDRPVAQPPIWREDSGALFLLHHDRGLTRVVEVDRETGAVAVQVPEVGGTRLYLPSAGGQFGYARGTFAFTTAHPDRPAGLGIRRGDGTPRVLDLNARWMVGITPARIEEVRGVSRADGREIQGWLMLPPGHRPGRRHPLILDIHGGPNTDYGPVFSLTHALYAAAGYIVLFTNPRGSIGYGRAFANLITGAYPGQDHDDLMSMVDAVARRPDVDSRQLFIGGGSGGGVLTLNAIGREPGKFRGAVALRPVTDWVNQVTTADLAPFFLDQWMGAPPWEAPQRYLDRSPLMLSGRITTPTLLITGEADFRTPIAQTEMMFGALKQRGVDVVMIRLPGANHGMGRPSQWLQSILAPIAFFDRLRGVRTEAFPAATPPSSPPPPGPPDASAAAGVPPQRR
ncbi:MAG: S9 family peptidase [Sphingomonadaceae bacterium]|uniref:S9 family peptidase n=1 Tax=Thermaurantiacus sp. TaxID=2820283 RepID=UPI00298F3448|nr:S9 family peptidase [Thermaurantiacus sp.]MCS6986591.1 S9 family peptidase [Sphingomonadaceae bacterium]MDW8414148.1 S9 family peptidase [Thermaurantiacus sp.]